jgi:hypothetical protein
MATEIEQQCETIEECYEFALSYAARGVSGDNTGDAGKQMRDYLTRAAAAMRGLVRNSAETIQQEELASAEKYEAFFAVLKRDAESAVAAVELVLAQPAIGSQLIDNLNASIHLRALLADLFLVTEILAVRQAKAAAAANGVAEPH